MKSFLTASALLAAAATAWPTNIYATNESSIEGRGPAVITADEIRQMGNNSLFTRWRPTSHVLAPAGWLNDPCGPMYDPAEDQYHIFYQWHPHHVNWGNISWGHAVSQDMVTWTDVGGWESDDALALYPPGNGSYNGLGIFSGTAVPYNLETGEQDGTLSIFYTAVSRLPTNWRLPYLQGTEQQAYAISTDGGNTWDFDEEGPVITTSANDPPMDWNITGFRDPFLIQLPVLDEILEKSEPHWYSVYGSGIHGVGPRLPLWSAPISDARNWTFEGSLWEPSNNDTLGPVLSTATYGFNFEVSGLFDLPDREGNPHWFINVGTEGNNFTWHHPQRWALWNEGNISRRDNGSAEFTPTAGGAADWGLGYAVTSFNDTKNNRRIQWNWISEDIVGDADLDTRGSASLFSTFQQGFQGSMAYPEEMFVLEVDDVLVTPELEESRSAVLSNYSASGLTATARVLGKRILPEIQAGIRNGSTLHTYADASFDANTTTLLSRNGSSHMNLHATLSLTSSAPAGFVIAASPDMEEYTTITYHPSNNTIIADRTYSSAIDEFQSASLTGYFYPYTIVNATTGVSELEDLDFDIVVDGSAVEVHVNDRFTMTLRVYPSRLDSVGYGVYVGGSEDEGDTRAEVSDIQAWVGLQGVWPERPVNTSSTLVFDGPELTNNGTWWDGH